MGRFVGMGRAFSYNGYCNINPNQVRAIIGGKMTEEEQELIEQMAKQLCKDNHYTWDTSGEARAKYLLGAKHLLAIFKQAGYKSPAEVEALCKEASRKTSITIGDNLTGNLHKWAEDNGYVKLAEDQSLPAVVTSYQDTEYIRGFTEGSKYERAQLKADNFRRVILPKG